MPVQTHPAPRPAKLTLSCGFPPRHPLYHLLAASTFILSTADHNHNVPGGSLTRPDARNPKMLKAWIIDAVNGHPESELNLLSPNLSSADAQMAIDEIWKLLEHSSEPQATLRGLCFKMSRRHNALPTALFLQGVKRNKTEASAYGGFADVYEGTFGNTAVALKRPRAHVAAKEDEKVKLKRAFYRESLVWKHLSHENILQFYGVCEDLFKDGAICIVIPWVSEGNIRVYIERFRLRYELTEPQFTAFVDEWLYQIAKGLDYLHKEGIVHGDLHPGNYLVSGDGRILLTDFGMARMAEGTSLTANAEQGVGARRYLAPELFAPEEFGLQQSQPTPASDVYAFGLTGVELHAGTQPFANCGEFQLAMMVVGGKRPSRPSLPNGDTMSDVMWSLTTSCWVPKPADRPSCDYVVDQLKEIAAASALLRDVVLRSPAAILPPAPMPTAPDVREALSDSRRAEIHDLIRSAVPSNPDDPTDVSKIPESYAQDAVDQLSKLLTGGSEVAVVAGRVLPLKALKKLGLKLAITYEVLPARFSLHDVQSTGQVAQSLSGNLNVLTYRGKWGNQVVALKRFRVGQEMTMEDVAQRRKTFCCRSFIWYTLNHEHVLPLLGVSYDAFESSPCMVSPWMSGGNILDHIEKFREHIALSRRGFAATVDNWLYQIALGVTYIHAEGIAHGDLCLANILIDKNDNVRLTGFGHGLIAEANAGNYASKHSEDTSVYAAPELLDPSRFGMVSSRPTRASDMYAFGIICCELYSDWKAFLGWTGLNNARAVLRGERPQRPGAPASGERMSDSMWRLTVRCWAQEPAQRPSARDVADEINAILFGGKPEGEVNAILPGGKPKGKMTSVTGWAKRQFGGSRERRK